MWSFSIFRQFLTYDPFPKLSVYRSCSSLSVRCNPQTCWSGSCRCQCQSQKWSCSRKPEIIINSSMVHVTVQGSVQFSKKAKSSAIVGAITKMSWNRLSKIIGCLTFWITITITNIIEIQLPLFCFPTNELPHPLCGSHKLPSLLLILIRDCSQQMLV